MYRRTRQTLRLAFATITAASLAVAAGPEPNSGRAVAALPAGNAVAVETLDLQPFSNIAYIPRGADLSSITFEGAKAVQVATKRTFIADKRYCGGGGPEPGGSMFCPSVQDEYPVPATRITYSYNGPAMASDEYGNTRFTFSVNVRPEDLNATALQTLLARKADPAAVAEVLKIATAQVFVQQVAIDGRNSTFCAGTYTDGGWTHTDANCKDKVTNKMVTGPSSYIAVKVNPASSPVASLRRQ